MSVETYAALVDVNGVVRNVVVIDKQLFDSGFLGTEYVWLGTTNATIGEALPPDA